jgi:hypothetical protein
MRHWQQALTLPDRRRRRSPGNDLTCRFPLILETLARLRSRPASSMVRRSFAMTTGSLRSIAFATAAIFCHFLYAFDLIER